MPKEICETPLDEKEIEARPLQFRYGTAVLREFKRGLRNNKQFALDIPDTRRKSGIRHAVVDRRVVQAMAGGLERMYDDMHCSGQGELADEILVFKQD